MDIGEAFPEYSTLAQLPRGSTHYRVDLHVHSPRSSDYGGGDTTARAISAEEFVAEYQRRGFRLIAVTDHNAGAFIDEAVAASSILSRGNEPIDVLPGVELYVSPGIHLLAILPLGGGSAAVSDLLSRLGLPVADHGKETSLILLPIQEIATVVHERGGLLVGAHCNSTKGVVQELVGQPRLNWLRHLDALEINCATGEEKVRSTVEYVTKSLGVQKAFTFGSDSHDARATYAGMWVKMARPDLDCLRQLIFEPQLRVTQIVPPEVSHGRILGFTTTRGLYGGQRFAFSPNLNVLIGGRGAGKSAVVDLLRFAFESEPRAEDREASDRYGSRIAGFLQGVGEVLVALIGNDGEAYAITRDGAFTTGTARQRAFAFPQRARVYQVVGETLIPRELTPAQVLAVEFYGQGEAARLADRVEEQLKLIDENLDHSEDLAQIDTAVAQLRAGEALLDSNNQRLADLHSQAAKRAVLVARESELAKSLTDPVFVSRTAWERERRWITQRHRWLTQAQETARVQLSPIPPTQVPDKSPSSDLLTKIEEVVRQAGEDAKSGIEQIADGLRKHTTEVGSLTRFPGLHGFRNHAAPAVGACRRSYSMGLRSSIEV